MKQSKGNLGQYKMKLTKQQLNRIIREEISTRKPSRRRMVDILFEAEGEEEEEKAEVQVTGDPGKDLEAAYAAGPQGVRAFMDAQGNKDEGVKAALVKAAEHHDGADPDDKISVGAGKPVAVGKLGPTQQFIDLMQSVAFPLGSAKVFRGLYHQ